ncbi:MAG TPA: ABC transporter substrate-binding protein, partial [Solirubrobacterales bacterium]
RNSEAEVKAVLDGRADWMQNPPPSSRFVSLQREFLGKQLRLDTVPSTYYFWMNTRKPPFDDLRVRRAANYAVNPGALRRIYGGNLAPTHQVLPPQMPGYKRFNLYPANLAKARGLIHAADPADRSVTVWTDTESPNREAGEYFADRLRKIGLKVRLKVLSADNYFTVIGSRRTKNLDAGWSNWFADYANPDDFFRPLLLGSSILPSNNGNFARIAVPRLDRAVERLRRQPPGSGTEEAYARLDRAYMKLAPWVPYGTRVLSTFVSKRVDLGSVVFNPMFGADIASFRFG